MKLLLALLRCGETEAEGQGRLLGMLDAPLSKKGKGHISGRVAKGHYPATELVFSSPLMRCRETAQILFPYVPLVVSHGLRALDHGAFSGKTQTEMSSYPGFQQWLMSRPVTACPGGEDPYAFLARSTVSFSSLVRELASKGVAQGAVVTHNLVINAILSRYCLPRSQYRDWSVPWGGGYLLEVDTQHRYVKIKENY